MEYKTLLERLSEHSGRSLAMHMPGHKRNIALEGAGYLEKLTADIDITEIDGFDDLYHAEGILKESMERAAMLFGTRKSFYLVNGSTQGILSAICSQIKRNDKVICARNCHKSVFNGLILTAGYVNWFMPETDENWGIYTHIDPDKLEATLNAAFLSLKAISRSGIICTIFFPLSSSYIYSI